MKKMVKFLDSIAGLGDPRPVEELDRKSAQMRVEMRGRQPKAVAERVIEQQIADLKKRDRYGERPIGFVRDFSFRPGQEAMIDGELAKNGEAAGICVAVASAAA